MAVGGHATELFADLQACVLHTDVMKPHRHCMKPQMLQRGESSRCGDAEH